MELQHDPYRVALELREQLASAKRRLGFFVRAGSSIAAGLPGIDELTTQVVDALSTPFKDQFDHLRSILGPGANVEDVLSHVRLCRELIANQADREIDGLKGPTSAKDLDFAICNCICQSVDIDPPNGLQAHSTFAQWLNTLHGVRDFPVEIFTTNYDLLIERALENLRVPYFDGFVGSVDAFFAPECVQAERA